MRSTIHGRSRWLVLIAILLLFLVGCTEDTEDPDADAAEDAEDEPASDDDGDDAEPVEGGTVRFGDEQEPRILNPLLLDGDSLVTKKVSANILPTVYKILPDFSLEPYLIDGEAEIGEDPFSVTYTIRDEAVWNDGTPVSAADLAFTYETIMAGEEGPDGFEGTWNISFRGGYHLIEDYEILDDKTIRFDFSDPYAPWRILFDSVLPAHVLEGEDFDEVWNDAIVDPATGEPISAGPFQFDSWDKGVQLRLVRNESYWGDRPAIEQIVLRYVTNTTSLVQQLQNDGIDMIDPQPQVQLVEQLEELSDRVTYEVGEGVFWEHVDFNVLVDGLDEVFVRQAIAHGIDRETIAEVLIAPVNPDVEVLQNPVYMSNQAEYEPHFDRYDFSADRARTILEDNGCELGDDDVYVCDGTRLSFRISTTGGNERRELAQVLIQSDLSNIGIEIVIDNEDGTEVFDRFDTPEACGGVCDYDIALFGWIGAPDPVGSANIYGCGRPQNWMGWCDEEVTEAMDNADMTLDPAERARLYNGAVDRMAEQVPTLPLFQQPQLLAWNRSIVGPQLNATIQTNFWNVSSWSLVQ